MPDIGAIALQGEQIPHNVMTKTTKQKRGTDGEMVSYVEDLNKWWAEAHSNDRDRLFDNLKAYFDINGGAWPESYLADMEAQGRHVASFNIAEQKLNTLAGSIQSERWDFAFTPIGTKPNSLTSNIKHLYYADKEQYNYQASENIALIHGLVHRCYEEMYIDYNIRPSGAIAFKPVLPGMILSDPYWMSDDIKDLKRAIKHAWMTAKQIKEFYEIDSHEINIAIEQDDIGGQRYEQYDQVDEFKEVQYARRVHGARYLVIEYRWLEHYKTTRLYARLPQGQWLPLPVGAKEGEVRDIMARLGVSGIDSIREFQFEDDELNLMTCAPHLMNSKLLWKGKHDVQCGNIGLFHFSSAREMGLDKGIMESLLDIQRTLNYRQSKIDDIIASGGSGAVAVDVNKLQNQKRTLDEYKQNKTRPDYVLPVNGDPNNIVKLLETTVVPESILRDVNSLIDYFDRVTPVTPALEGAATRDESGILFEMRHAVTKLGTSKLYDRWRHFLTVKAEAWYNQARNTYRGIYIKVDNTEMPGEVEFNVPEYQNGTKVYINSIETLPRAAVAVTLSKNSPTEQLSQRAMLYDMIKVYSAHPELFKFQIRLATNKMMQTMELQPEERQILAQYTKIQAQIDTVEQLAQLETLMANALNSKVLQAQASQMLQQMQQQIQQPQAGMQIPQTQGNVPELSVQSSQERSLVQNIPTTGGSPEQSVQTPRGEFVP